MNRRTLNNKSRLNRNHTLRNNDVMMNVNKHYKLPSITMQNKNKRRYEPTITTMNKNKKNSRHKKQMDTG